MLTVLDCHCKEKREDVLGNQPASPTTHQSTSVTPDVVKNSSTTGLAEVEHVSFPAYPSEVENVCKALPEVYHDSFTGLREGHDASSDGHLNACKEKSHDVSPVGDIIKGGVLVKGLASLGVSKEHVKSGYKCIETSDDSDVQDVQVAEKFGDVKAQAECITYTLQPEQSPGAYGFESSERNGCKSQSQKGEGFLTSFEDIVSNSRKGHLHNDRSTSEDILRPHQEEPAVHKDLTIPLSTNVEVILDLNSAGDSNNKKLQPFGVENDLSVGLNNKATEQNYPETSEKEMNFRDGIFKTEINDARTHDSQALGEVYHAFREIDDIAAIPIDKYKISVQVAGDKKEIANLQFSELKDGFDDMSNFVKVKINEIMPDSETHIVGKDNPLNNVLKHKRVNSDGSYSNAAKHDCLSTKEDNHCGEPGDFKIESAMSLVRSYISELERVATKIETILKSHSSEVTTESEDGDIIQSSALSNGSTPAGQQQGAGVPMDIVPLLETENKELMYNTKPVFKASPSFVDKVSQEPVNVLKGDEDLVSLKGQNNNYNLCEVHETENVLTKKETSPEQSTELAMGTDFTSQGTKPERPCFTSLSESKNSTDVEVEVLSNLNNNGVCDAEIVPDNDGCNICVDVPTSSNVRFMNESRKSQRLACCYDEKGTQKVKASWYISKSIIHNNPHKDENTNNNGNTTNYAPRNFAISSGTPSGSIVRNKEFLTLRKRTQGFADKITFTGNDLLVFDSGKIYSIPQKTMKSNELIGRVLCDMGNVKDQQMDTLLLADVIDSRCSRSEAVSKMPETSHSRTTQLEKSGQLQLDCATDCKRVHCGVNQRAVKSILNEMAQIDQNICLDYSSSDTSQISHAETKPNNSQNEMQANINQLRADAVDSAKDEKTHISPKCELQPRKKELTREHKSTKKTKNTKSSKTGDSLTRKHQRRKERNIDDSERIHFDNSTPDVVASIHRVTQQDEDRKHNSTSPKNRKRYGRKAHEPTISEDDRWASAIGNEEIKRTVDVKKTGFPRKTDFPIRIRSVLKHGEKGAYYVPDRTRRLTLESPAENLLVHTTYVRPNPNKPENEISIEMPKHKSRLYLGQDDDDYINTDGTRRLICETECFSTKDPETNNLVIENGIPTFSNSKIKTVSRKVKKERKRDASLAMEAWKMVHTGSEVAETGFSETGGKSVMWYGARCVRMIGNYVVIGTAKNMRSIMHMIQNQKMLSITASDDTGLNAETAHLPEAGDVGGTAKRKMAVNDRSRSDGSGDHLILTAADADYSNSNNNNGCTRREITRGHHRQKLPSKTTRCLRSNSCIVKAVAVNEPLVAKRAKLFNGRSKNTFINFRRSSSDTKLFNLKSSFRFECVGANIYRYCTITINRCGNIKNTVHLYEVYFLPPYKEFNLLSLESNRNNSSASEGNELPERYNNGRREIDHTRYSDSSRPHSPERTYLEDSECPAVWCCCSLSDSFKFNEQLLERSDLETQVGATDINTTAETQTRDYITSRALISITGGPTNKLLDMGEFYLREPKKKVESRRCYPGQCHKHYASCCEHHLSTCYFETKTQETGTQVEATDISPSHVVQTGDSYVSISPFTPSKPLVSWSLQEFPASTQIDLPTDDMSSQDRSFGTASQDISFAIASQVRSFDMAPHHRLVDIDTQHRFVNKATQDRFVDMASHYRSFDMASQDRCVDVASQLTFVDIATRDRFVDMASQYRSLDLATRDRSIDVASLHTSFDAFLKKYNNPHVADDHTVYAKHMLIHKLPQSRSNENQPTHVQRQDVQHFEKQGGRDEHPVDAKALSGKTRLEMQESMFKQQKNIHIIQEAEDDDTDVVVVVDNRQDVQQFEEQNGRDENPVDAKALSGETRPEMQLAMFLQQKNTQIIREEEDDDTDDVVVVVDNRLGSGLEDSVTASADMNFQDDFRNQAGNLNHSVDHKIGGYRDVLVSGVSNAVTDDVNVLGATYSKVRRQTRSVWTQTSDGLKTHKSLRQGPSRYKDRVLRGNTTDDNDKRETDETTEEEQVGQEKGSDQVDDNDGMLGTRTLFIRSRPTKLNLIKSNEPENSSDEPYVMY